MIKKEINNLLEKKFECLEESLRYQTDTVIENIGILNEIRWLLYIRNKIPNEDNVCSQKSKHDNK